MSRTHLNILIHLAKVDGVVVQEEIDLINKIGKANGLSEDEISACFDEPNAIESMVHLPDDVKFDFIYSIVQLMKIDGRIYKEELSFCAKMASKLGYDSDVLLELIPKIYSDPHLTTDPQKIKSKIQHYLIEKP